MEGLAYGATAAGSPCFPASRCGHRSDCASSVRPVSPVPQRFPLPGGPDGRVMALAVWEPMPPLRHGGREGMAGRGRRWQSLGQAPYPTRCSRGSRSCCCGVARVPCLIIPSAVSLPVRRPLPSPLSCTLPHVHPAASCLAPRRTARMQAPHRTPQLSHRRGLNNNPSSFNGIVPHDRATSSMRQKEAWK